MRGKKAKALRRERSAQLLAAVEEVKTEEGGDKRIIIIEGTKFDDVIEVPVTTPDEELEVARRYWANVHPGDVVINLIRMVHKSEG